MHILWDMDGPLVQFEKRVHDILVGMLPDADVIPLEARTSFRLRDQYHPKYRELLLEIMCGKGFYLDMEPVESSICAMNEQLADGHEVNIVTSPLLESQVCVQEKFEWVRLHLGQAWLERLIISYDKTNVRGDVLIDDKPDITGRGQREWRQVIYDMPYNRQVENMPRLTDPSQWRKIVLSQTPHLFR